MKLLIFDRYLFKISFKPNYVMTLCGIVFTSTSTAKNWAPVDTM